MLEWVEMEVGNYRWKVKNTRGVRDSHMVTPVIMLCIVSQMIEMLFVLSHHINDYSGFDQEAPVSPQLKAL